MAIRKKSGLLSLRDFEKALFCLQFSAIADALEKEFGTRHSERSLSMMVYQIQTFMEDNCGKQSPQPRVITKLPFALFRDFAVNGAVHSILRSALRLIAQQRWDKFDILLGDRKQVGLQFLKQLEASLIKSKLLQRPIIYFDKVSEDLIPSLRTIVLQHGGLIGGSPEFATHIVDWDEEVDTLPDDLTEEYVRTLELRPLEDGGIALVHWYYYPDCYDEWIPAQDVDAVDPPDSNQMHSFADKETDCADVLHQPWRVCCRFIRDCDTFNEWGNEYDYEIVDDTDGSGTVAMEEDDVGTPGGLASSTHKTNRSPGSGRKGRKSDAMKKSSISSSVPGTPSIALRKDIPVLESTTVCTDRMMQNAPPPSRDRLREKYAVVDIVSPVGGAPGSYPGSGITSQTYTLTMEAVQGTYPAGVVGSVTVKTEDVIEAKESDDLLASSGDAPATKKRKAETEAGDFGTSAALNSELGSKLPSGVPTTTLSIVPSIPDWFASDSISSMEIRYLPSFFAQDYSTQSRETYLAMRTAIINMYAQSPYVYLSATDCRRRLAGDACAILKLHEFLDAFKIINTFVRPELRPPMPVHVHGSALASGPRFSCSAKTSTIWTKQLDRLLVKFAYQSNGDWSRVCELLNEKGGVKVAPEVCLSRFVEFPSGQLLRIVQEYDSDEEETQDGAAPSSSSGTLKSVKALRALEIRHLTAKSPASISSQDLILLRSKIEELKSQNMTLEEKSLGIVGELAKSTLSNCIATTEIFVDDYLNVRLRALEDKVALIAAVRREIENERQQLSLERRDIQVQRAMLASLGQRFM